MPLVETYINLKNQIETQELLKNKTQLNLQINLIITYLENNNYIYNDESQIKLTKYGKILSEINECNPFILGYIIFSDLFDKLEFDEIVAICSVLVNEYKNEEIYISDLECSNMCKELLKNIEIEIEKFEVYQNTLNNDLPYPVWLDWKINYAAFNDVKKWNNDIVDIDITLVNGNFIKTILRLNNILKNLEIIAKLFDKIILINKLDGFQEKLIRDIVISDSLYL